MSKAETIDALMESAIFSFSKYGYEGASLRDIARNAGVPLSTIHLYFGTKAELFMAVRQKAWNDVDAERTMYLQEALARTPAEPPLLHELVYALAFPIVRRALGKSDYNLAQISVLRSHLAHTPHSLSSEMLEVADRSMVRWIDAMVLCCPTLSRQDIIWGFSFVIGAIYSWQLIDHRYDKMLGEDIERTVEDVAGDIVAFCCSGIQAIVDRRAAASRDGAN